MYHEMGNKLISDISIVFSPLKLNYQIISTLK